MMYQLSFATIKLLTDDLAEIIVNNGVEVSLEMIEELDELLNQAFQQPYTLLVNKINHYDYSFEAKFTVASHNNLIAMAIVNYDDISQDPIQEILTLRAIDQLNIKVFSGLELGWQQAKNWLTTQLIKAAV